MYSWERPEQYRTKQTDRTGQNTTGQGRTGQDKADRQDRTGQSRQTEQCRTGPRLFRTNQTDRTGQARTVQDRARRLGTGQGRAGSDRTRRDRTGACAFCVFRTAVGQLSGPVVGQKLLLLFEKHLERVYKHVKGSYKTSRRPLLWIESPKLSKGLIQSLKCCLLTLKTIQGV